MARVLLVDDDRSLLDVLSLAFEDEGHEVRVARDGHEALAIVREGWPSAVVSDVNMPRLDGFAMTKKLREEGFGVPLLLLTSREGEIDEALGLSIGADDYVAKPFSTRVLLARVAALLRREAMRVSSEREELITRGALELSPERLEARYRGTQLVVTVTEFRLLEALSKRPGLVLSRERLMTLIRDDDSVVADRIIDTYVRRLRRKLEEIDPACDAIQTVIGAGYRWRADG
jgi:DNA-binding response OmpR family regulator